MIQGFTSSVPLGTFRIIEHTFFSFIVVPLKADYRPISTSVASKRPAENVAQVASTEEVVEPVKTQAEATIRSEEAQEEPRITHKTLSFSELREIAETHTKLKEALHQQVQWAFFSPLIL